MKQKTIVSLLLAFCITSSLSAATTVSWWQFWTDEGIKPTLDSIVREFEAAHPDIDVDVTDLTWANGHEKIVIALASGTGPDVLELGSDWIAQFASEGKLANISADIASDSSTVDGWGMSTYEGQVYAYPWILGTRVIFGNRDLMTKAGRDTNYYPVTWSDLLSTAKLIRKIDKNTYGWGSNIAEKHRLYKKFLPFFWSGGGELYTPDGKYVVLASMKGIDALLYYQQLHDSAGYVADQRGIEDAFLAGKVGFVFSGDWLLKRIMQEKPNFPLVTTLVPGPKFPGFSFLGGEFLAVNAATKNKNSALAFVRYLTAPEQQVRFCKANFSANPSSKTAQKDPFFTSNPHLDLFIRQMHLAKHPPVDPDWVEIETDIEAAVEDALFGSKLVAQPLWRAQKKIVQLKSK